MQNKSYKMAGLFVIIGALCFAGIVFNYIGKKFMTDKKDLVVMYFTESVRGLSVGSQVVLQGVEVGQVNKISLMANIEEGTFKTPVYVMFDKKKVSSYQDAGEKGYLSGREILEHLIKKGLKARLISANYLTGQLMIELVMDPEQPAVFRGNGEYREIPTVLSAFAKFSKDLTDIPLHESLLRLGDLLANLNSKLPEVLSNIAEITNKFDNLLLSRSREISNTLNNINSTMEEFAKASRSVKNLTDYLERHPEAIIQGKEN